MATAKQTVEYILEQLEPLNVRSRAMFGEFCLWCDDKVVALICDDTLFLKPTRASEDRGMREAEAYPGSKFFRVVDQAIIDDSDTFRELVHKTADALPIPRRRQPRTSR
jgi:TfoX/Sxy family transcriptional regulator of competence genes